MHVHIYRHATPVCLGLVRLSVPWCLHFYTDQMAQRLRICAHQLGIDVDHYCLGRGVTTAVDAGSAGATTFMGICPLS